MRASFVRLVGVVFITWILTQPAAHAQGADDELALNSQDLPLYDRNQYAALAEVAERDLSDAEKIFGPEHVGTLSKANALAAFYKAQGRFNEAEPLYQRVLAGFEKAYGPEHSYTLVGAVNLAVLYQARGRHDEAEALYKRALASREAAYGPENALTLRHVNYLAALYHAQAL